MAHPVVLITDALTGIGRATALAFAKNGAHLVVSGRRETRFSPSMAARLQVDFVINPSNTKEFAS